MAGKERMSHKGIDRVSSRQRHTLCLYEHVPESPVFKATEYVHEMML